MADENLHLVCWRSWGQHLQDFYSGESQKDYEEGLQMVAYIATDGGSHESSAVVYTPITSGLHFKKWKTYTCELKENTYTIISWHIHLKMDLNLQNYETKYLWL